MSNPLATLIHSAIATVRAAGVDFLPDVSVKLTGKPEDIAKAIELAKVEHKRLTELTVASDKPEVLRDHAEAVEIARRGMDGVKLVTHRQRVNKFVSDACSSRDGSAIVTKMTLAKVSFTVARAQAKVNGKTAEASQAFASAVCLINLAESIRQLHSVCDTGWELPVSETGFKPRKFNFATASKTEQLTDKTIAKELAAAK